MLSFDTLGHWRLIRGQDQGMNDTASKFGPGRRFFIYWALLFLCHQFGLSLYRFISTLARNIVIANAAGMMLLLCVFLMNGFVIQRRYLHPWVLWSASLLPSVTMLQSLQECWCSVAFMISELMYQLLAVLEHSSFVLLIQVCYSIKTLQA